MDPILIGMLVVQGVSAIAGWISESNANEEERQRRLAALAEYASIQPPEVRELIGQGVRKSAFERIQADQGLQAVQDEAQQRLLERGRNGASLAYRAEREQSAMETAARARSNREGVLADSRARGTVGSGEELLAQFQGDSAAAETERLAGVQQLAADEEAALNSIIAAGDMASTREQRDLDLQVAQASAEDDIAMFNAGVQNQFSIYNDQQRWNQAEYRLDLARARANAQNGLADSARSQGNANARMIGGLGQAAGYGLAAYGQYQQQNPSRVTSRPATPGEVQAPATIGTGAAIGGTAARPTTTQQSATRRRAR